MLRETARVRKTLNPVTKIYVGENSVFTLETTQISGVDCTERENYIELADNAKLFVTEKLMTDEEQSAVSNMDIELNGTNSSARIVSRSVGKEIQNKSFIRERSAITGVMHMCSVIRLLWIRQR